VRALLYVHLLFTPTFPPRTTPHAAGTEATQDGVVEAEISFNVDAGGSEYTSRLGLTKSRLGLTKDAGSAGVSLPSAENSLANISKSDEKGSSNAIAEVALRSAMAEDRLVCRARRGGTEGCEGAIVRRCESFT